MDQNELTRQAEELLTRAGLGEPFGVVSVPEAARMCEAFTAGASVEAIAEGLRRNPETVRDTLGKFKSTVDASRERLKAGALTAADRWVHIASTGNNHQAAKDLLLHTGAIEPLADGYGSPKIGIQVIIGTPEHPCPAPAWDTGQDFSVDKTPKEPT